MSSAHLKSTLCRCGQWGFNKLAAPLMRAMGRRLLSWSASGNIKPPEVGADQWKKRALEDFSAWLSAAPAQGPGPEPSVEACDLYTLLTEFAALRQEITLQTRQQRATLRTQSDLAERFQTIGEHLGARISRLDEVHDGLRRGIEAAAVHPFLDVRDTLARGEAAATKLSRKPSFFSRRPRGIENIPEGYRMALRRFDRALDRLGIRPIPTIDHPFDPHCMRAVGKGHQADKGPGTVLEEVLGGFTRGNEILRTAEVVVNSKEGIDE